MVGDGAEEGAVPCGLLAQSYHSRLFMFSIPYGGVSRGSRRSPAAGPCKRPPCSTTRSPVASALGYALSMLSETLRDRKLISLGRSFLAESDLISGAAARQPCLFVVSSDGPAARVGAGLACTTRSCVYAILTRSGGEPPRE